MPIVLSYKNEVLKSAKSIFPLVVFIATFLIVPFEKSSFLSMMPGDIGDARLNNYFLENIYQFFKGSSESLWHLSFFNPFPYVLGFSDNLFGSSPAYLLARFLTGKPDTAFQIWYLFGYFANFFAAFFSLGRLGHSRVASAIGAMIFAFALPVTARSGHAQLHYRFGVPLSIAMFVLFLDDNDWRYFVASAFWIVWQFYCTIYIGFFTMMVLVALLTVHLLHGLKTRSNRYYGIVIDFVYSWHYQPPIAKWKNLIALSILFSLLILLLFPYLRVTQLYGASRSLSEIGSMLPRPQSYFLSDGSFLWSSLSNVLRGIPVRHEHQMFVGVVPMILAFLGFFWGSREKNGAAFLLLSASLVGLIVITLYMGRFSLWYFFARLPLGSAIRAMTRIDLVLLFPVAYLSAIAVDYLLFHFKGNAILIFIILIPAMIFEFSATSSNSSAKSEWRDRIASIDAVFPNRLPPDPIVFFAQAKGPYFAAELDAMWVAISHGVKTLNGYSGFSPPGFAPQFGNDCSELPRRILSYLAFTGRGGDQEAYLDLMRRVVPIGFMKCEDQWMDEIPIFSIREREYSANEIRKLSFQYVGKSQQNGKWLILLRIFNANDQSISAASAIGKPIRLSWRFVDSSGVPIGGWDTRKDLPSDIGPSSALDLKLIIDPEMEIKNGALQVSLVQEGVFWGHDVGLSPLTIPWNSTEVQ